MKLLICFLLVMVLSPQVSALEIEAPQVPPSGVGHMPENTSSFGDGLLDLVRSVTKTMRPDLAEASRVCLAIVSVHIIVSIIRVLSSSIKGTANLAGCSAIAAILSGVVVFILQELVSQRKNAKNKALDIVAEHESESAEQISLILKSLKVIGKLTYANSIALRDGRTNGELKSAMKEYESVDAEMYEYLITH